MCPKLNHPSFPLNTKQGVSILLTYLIQNDIRLQRAECVTCQKYSEREELAQQITYFIATRYIRAARLHVIYVATIR